MADAADRLILAGLLAGAAFLVLFWPQKDGRRDWRGALRHPALWVLISLAVSFGATALLAGHGIVALGVLPFLGALWPDRGGAKPQPPPAPRAVPPPKAMTRAEALAVLGLTPSTTREEVLEAYRHMMWFANPDHGGSQWLADRLNEARDVLLKR
ncbi:hypothetical protein AiwAL_10485 [Acidiphilium sp. AL]|uniref:J domain-containing protein n=1 Tax=Acidiphilium iwatense TaxID=768198 RepID=A0ABS9DQV0_9PROT|nr:MULTISPECIES: hypothetical protein [Acidiphilium]MCF3945128.1 hypothetical protein [Acidiphilium iwatense]MCU4160527.1 hypothetical protein [Acidiphilium sp. AL]